jgi:uncharacterized protein (TIGR01370 family)
MHPSRLLQLVIRPSWWGSMLAALVGASALGQQPPSVSPPPWTPEQTRFCIDYSLIPDSAVLRSHDLCIVAVTAQVEMSSLKEDGCTMLAYASMVEVQPGSREAEAAKSRGIPIITENTNWNSSVLDITHPAWLPWVLEELAKPAFRRGFDGLFLDTLDSAQLISRAHPEKAEACRSALVYAIQQLKKRHPEKRLVLNRGFDLLPDVAKQADAVLVESLYQTWDGTRQKYRAVSQDDAKWLLSRVAQVKRLGLPVFVVDYVAPNNAVLARTTARRIEAQGCIPFVSTPELQGNPHFQPEGRAWTLHEEVCQ